MEIQTLIQIIIASNITLIIIVIWLIYQVYKDRKKELTEEEIEKVID